MALLFLSGPGLNMKVDIIPVNLPADIDEYVTNNEKKVANLVPGAEKKIIWVKRANEKTEYSLVYFHGFATSRQEISPVTETVAERLGANVFFTRLKGHGIDDIDALGTPVMNDWLNDAWEAYEIGKKIGNKVIFISASAGSVFVFWLSLRQQCDIAANIVISPLFEPARGAAGLLLLPGGNLILRLLVGKYREVSSPTQEERFKKLISCKYPSKALLTVMSLCKLSWGLKLEQLRVPTLCFYTDNDKVISISRLKSELGKIDDQYIKMVKVNTEHHCLVGDAVSPEMNGEVIQKMMEFLADKSVVSAE